MEQDLNAYIKFTVHNTINNLQKQQYQSPEQPKAHPHSNSSINHLNNPKHTHTVTAVSVTAEWAPAFWCQYTLYYSIHLRHTGLWV